VTDYFLKGHDGKKVSFRLPAGWQVLRNAVTEAEKKFKDPLEDRRGVKKIPRSQRHVSRPSLERIFRGKGGKNKEISTSILLT
jgi:hypothetical protein